MPRVAEKAAALAHSLSTRARTPRPRTCRGLTCHFHILLYLSAGEARAQTDALRWTDCQRARYLRSPVPSLPTIRNRMALQNKTVNKGHATNVRAATDRIHGEGSRGCSEPGDSSDYTTPDSRADTKRRLIYELRPPVAAAADCSIRLFLASDGHNG